ncbi:hypothetical protein ACFU6R_03535 [Streptomyces sp. NPDC057499]|uniref:hypothetical protein n=1 Tax=Streptomyces sp. NPDC057499 TaxID=3346150 RepID=UPI003694CB2D
MVQDLTGLIGVLNRRPVGNARSRAVNTAWPLVALDAIGSLGRNLISSPEGWRRESCRTPLTAVRRSSGAALGGLPALQDRLQEFDGGEFGEARDSNSGQPLGGTRHILAGTDPRPGVVRRLQTLPGDFRPAGQRA